jgi:hypothetical protein
MFHVPVFLKFSVFVIIFEVFYNFKIRLKLHRSKFIHILHLQKKKSKQFSKCQLVFLKKYVASTHTLYP